MSIALFIPIIALAIPIVALTGTLVIKPWIALQHRKLEIEADLVRERAQIDGARQERLEARLAVIERIVTDRGGSLSDEIERLRDRPLN